MGKDDYLYVCQCKEPLVQLSMGIDGWRAYCKRCNFDLTYRMDVCAKGDMKLRGRLALSICRKISQNKKTTVAEIEWVSYWIRAGRPTDYKGEGEL